MPKPSRDPKRPSPDGHVIEKPAGVTLKQHRYYRGVIVPAMREYCGFLSDDLAHKHNMAGFYGMPMESKRLPSMADMSQDEANRFMEYVRMRAAEAGLDIRDPEAPGSEHRAKADSVFRDRIFEHDTPSILGDGE